MPNHLDCDSIEGITNALNSATTFYQLLKTREDAATKSSLSDWVALGRFILTSRGKCYKLVADDFDAIIPAEKFPQLPKVIAFNEIFAYMKENGGSDDYQFKYSLKRTSFPAPGQICPVCHKGWEIKNYHDYVDLCAIDPQKCKPSDIFNLLHEKCYRSRQAQNQRRVFLRIFKNAGFQDITLVQIPNQYHGDKCLTCAPWYQAVAYGITFTIGYRKHVISITLDYPSLNLTTIFKNEKVTKDTNTIHAPNRKKCIEYLQTIRIITSMQH